MVSAADGVAESIDKVGWVRAQVGATWVLRQRRLCLERGVLVRTQSMISHASLSVTVPCVPVAARRFSAPSWPMLRPRRGNRARKHSWRTEERGRKERRRIGSGVGRAWSQRKGIQRGSLRGSAQAVEGRDGRTWSGGGSLRYMAIVVVCAASGDGGAPRARNCDGEAKLGATGLVQSDRVDEAARHPRE